MILQSMNKEESVINYSKTKIRKKGKYGGGRVMFVRDKLKKKKQVLLNQPSIVHCVVVVVEVVVVLVPKCHRKKSYVYKISIPN